MIWSSASASILSPSSSLTSSSQPASPLTLSIRATTPPRPLSFFLLKDHNDNGDQNFRISGLDPLQKRDIVFFLFLDHLQLGRPP